MNIQQFEHYAEIHTDPELDKISSIEEEEEAEIEIELVSAEVLAAEKAAAEKAAAEKAKIRKIEEITNYAQMILVICILCIKLYVAPWNPCGKENQSKRFKLIFIISIVLLSLHYYILINNNKLIINSVYSIISIFLFLIYYWYCIWTKPHLNQLNQTKETTNLSKFLLTTWGIGAIAMLCIPLII